MMDWLIGKQIVNWSQQKTGSVVCQPWHKSQKEAEDDAAQGKPHYRAMGEYIPPMMDYAEWVKAEYDMVMYGNSIVAISDDGVKHIPILETIDPTKWEPEK